MGTLRACGYCVAYYPSGETRSLHKTWRGAQRAHRLASEAGRTVVIWTCWHTSSKEELL